MDTTANRPGGAQTSSNFFAAATANRLALVPGASLLAGYSNRPRGTGGAMAYNSRVKSSQQNGAGPAIPPISSPFSFTQFATGVRTLKFNVRKKLGA